ncbi:MAG: hypothetical protein JNM82_07080, partial [Rhodocyclaceae bacterium]|nr:hypothetical protein [Rhodocyclaceae bacterium]
LGPINLLLTAQANGQEGRQPSSKAIANEAYADFGSGADRFTLGRKIMSGDVGYGFRPLDVVQRENRRQLAPPALEGIPVVAWERYTAESAWSLIYANPGHGRRGQARQDEAVALRVFRRAGSADLHGVLRLSGRHGAEIGAGFAAVPGESLEIHASALVQARGERLAVPSHTGPAILNPDQAYVVETVRAPRRALAGFTWTWEGGWSLLGEAWWDGTAPGKNDWRRLRVQSDVRRVLAGIPAIPAGAVAGVVATSTRLYEVENLQRRNALGRVSWTDPSGDGWSAALELLLTPEDRGRVATATLGREFDGWKIEAGLRRYAGPAGSAWRMFPERGAAFVSVSLAY